MINFWGFKHPKSSGNLDLALCGKLNEGFLFEDS